jgi:two-component system, LytTR family, response regulator
MLKAIIVDDEAAALRSLELLLQAYCPNVTLVAKGQSVKEGLELIKKHNPDIVFLDIEMPKGNGFELLEQAPDLNFEVIFITAYNQYAIKAFKYSAIDYILKPIDVDELVQAVNKVTELRSTKVNPRERYAVLFQNIKEIIPRKLVLPTSEGFIYIDLNRVTYLAQEGTTLKFFLQDDSSTIECENVNLNLVDMLEEKGFIPIDDGFHVNLNKVIKVDKSGKGKIIFIGGKSLEFTTYNKEDFIDRLTEFNSKKNIN